LQSRGRGQSDLFKVESYAEERAEGIACAVGERSVGL
jgi:hypothetical protein